MAEKNRKKPGRSAQSKGRSNLGPTLEQTRRDFQKALKEEGRKRHLNVETAFIHWYVRVAFDVDSYDVTDGTKDGGIDAVVRIPRPNGRSLIYVIQSKYTEKFFGGKKVSALPVGAYTDLDSLPNVFASDAAFDAWLGTVESSLRDAYSRLRQDLRSPKNAVEWRLITLHARSRAGENRLVNLPADSFVYGASLLELFEMDLEGATPPGDPLELRFAESMTVEEPAFGHKSYVLAATVRDFIDYLDGDPHGRLFARNVRLNLQSKINEEIANTYESSPEEFWYSHNGITVVCSSATIDGKRIRMVNPSVINGSQTLNSLRTVRKRDPDAMVLTRVLVVGQTEGPTPAVVKTKKFVNDVIFRTNQQNKMYAFDLRANDVRQVELAREFIRERIFYERRRGEWKQRSRVLRNQGLDRTGIVQIAQVCAAMDPLLGPAIAKRGKEDLFRDDLKVGTITVDVYDRLFYQDFSDILLKYRVFRFADNCIKEVDLKSVRPRQRKHALMTVSAILWDSIAKSAEAKELRARPSLGSHLLHKGEGAENLKVLAGAIMRDCWTAWEEANKRDPTISPNNFFKSEKNNAGLRERLGKKYARRGGPATRAFLRKAEKALSG